MLKIRIMFHNLNIKLWLTEEEAVEDAVLVVDEESGLVVIVYQEEVYGYEEALNKFSITSGN